MNLSKEPAVLFGLIAALAAAVTQAIEAANAGGTFNVWTLLVVLVPLLAGIATRFHVVPVEVVKEIIGGARSSSVAVTDLANRVDVAITDRPGN